MKPKNLGSKYVEIVIDETGEVRVEAHGFAGRGCKEFTKPVEDALGLVTKTTAKPELQGREKAKVAR